MRLHLVLIAEVKLEATNNLVKLIKRNSFGFETLITLKTDFYRPEYKNGEDYNRPLQVLAFIQPTTVDKEPICDYSVFSYLFL